MKRNKTERVTGIGGIFFKSDQPKKLQTWYEKHLGLEFQPWGGVSFEWRERSNPTKVGRTVWSLFPKDTTYFKPSRAPFMINYRVKNLDRMLQQLRAKGVKVEKRAEESEFGRFAWVMDPEGNRIELWEPPKGR
jgi:predicted enzyme related to lactoylglutathione lyase